MYTFIVSEVLSVLLRIDIGGLCSYVISRARFMARCRSNSLGTRTSSATVLMSSPRAAVVVPLDLLLSCRRTSSSHFSSPSSRSSSLHRSGTKICRRRALRFLHSEDPNDGLNVATVPDLMVPLQERHRSFLFLSSPEMQHGPVRSSPENVFNWLCTYRTELSVKCFLRHGLILIFHPFDHWQEN